MLRISCSTAVSSIQPDSSGSSFQREEAMEVDSETDELWSLADLEDDDPALPSPSSSSSAAPLQRPRKRGGAIGTFSLGSRAGRAVRDRLLQQEGPREPETDAPSGSKSAAEKSSLSAHADTDAADVALVQLLSLHGRGGCRIHDHLLSCFANSRAAPQHAALPLSHSDAEGDEAESLPNKSLVERLLISWMGRDPWHGTGSSAAAQVVGTSRRTYERHLLRIAAATYFGSRMYVNAVCNSIAFELTSRKSLKLLCLLTYVLYDETPMSMRVLAPLQGAKHSNPESLASLLSTSGVTAPDPVHKDPSVAKLLQTEAQVVMVLGAQDQSSQLQLWRFPLLCPLQVLERATGAVLSASIKEQMHLDGLLQLRKLADISVHATTCDQAGSNRKAESNLGAEEPTIPRLVIPCSAHC